MPPPARRSLLVDLPESILWSARPWPAFAQQTHRPVPLVLLPMFGFADWGLGRGINLEETLGCGVLRAMLEADAGRASRLLVMPPLRFVPGPYPHSVFGIDFETALDLVREIAGSLAAAGVERLVFFNTSPWCEDLVKTSACDLRADFGLQTFAIHLGTLGLDLHPTRSTTRAAVQAAACALTHCGPQVGGACGDIRLPDFRPGHHRQPPPLEWSTPLQVAMAEGGAVLAEAGARLARLLAAIEAHPPLPHPRTQASRSDA